MVVKILEDNTDKFNNELLEYSLNIKALNFLKSNNKIDNNLYTKVKSAIEKNYSNKFCTFE